MISTFLQKSANVSVQQFDLWFDLIPSKEVHVFVLVHSDHVVFNFFLVFIEIVLALVILFSRYDPILLLLQFFGQSIGLRWAQRWVQVVLTQTLDAVALSDYSRAVIVATIALVWLIRIWSHLVRDCSNRIRSNNDRRLVGRVDGHNWGWGLLVLGLGICGFLFFCFFHWQREGNLKNQIIS